MLNTFWKGTYTGVKHNICVIGVSFFAKNRGNPESGGCLK
jgi:hypothetical protein